MLVIVAPVTTSEDVPSGICTKQSLCTSLDQGLRGDYDGFVQETKIVRAPRIREHMIGSPRAPAHPTGRPA